MINSFRGDYEFLSNFYYAPIVYDGIVYQNNEAAFQAQKTLDLKVREEFSSLSGKEAKIKGRKIELRSDWEQKKISIMHNICIAKFTQHPELGRKLLDTGNEILEEGNNWGDNFWGTVNGKGRNQLGITLMVVRLMLKGKEGN